MDAEQERIQADLQGLVAGEVRCDDIFLQLYASDASLYEIRPLGIVRPRHSQDVVACIRYAAERNIPIHARGAGTGIAGESLGPGLVIDFSHSMRRIVQISADTVRIQPGVVHAQLNRALAQHGRHFGPDPATSAVTTMGSVLTLDNSGSHFLKWGSARSRVVSLQVALASGAIVEVGRHPVEGDDRQFPEVATLAKRLAELIGREHSTIEAHRSKSMVNRSGYHLYDILREGQIDLARLIVGSEGTLALITEATVRTDPLPRHIGVELFFFDRLEYAARAANEAVRLGVTACDLMDRRLLGIARETDARYAAVIPVEAEAMLLVEQQGDNPRAVHDHLQQIVNSLVRTEQLAFAHRSTSEPEEVELYWRLATQVVSRLYSLKGHARAVPFVEDFAVPPEALPGFLVKLQNVLKVHQTTATVFGHAGHGQLHVRPILDLSNPEDVRKMQSLAEDLYEEVVRVGGTISGEHGDGLSRSWFVRRQYGPLYDVFREVKRIFDPQGIFNPGKVVAEAPQPLTKNLRLAVAAPGVAGNDSSEPVADEVGKNGELFEPLLEWNTGEVAAMSVHCNGCGHCRTELPDTRMCPIFRYAPREEASPRSKANLMRALLSGGLHADLLKGEAVKAVADLCVNCHQCRLECPANVDIPKLMIEAKAQFVATNGLKPSDAFLTRLDRFVPWASLMSSLTNWSIANRQMRWLLEKTLGIAQGRKLPRLATRSFLRLAHRRRWDRPVRRGDRKVIYFVDLYANWFDVKLAEAVVRVLEHNGVSVFVHPDQVASGMARIAHGDLERARPLAERNVSLLAEAVRQGYSIVTSEPTAALCLRVEYPDLLGDDDARLVAANTTDVTEYLHRLHQTGQLALDFHPLNFHVGYHLPCHLKALAVGSPGEQLLRLIPGLIVERLERGCSGMAGIWGLKRENYRRSLRAGWGLISALRDPEIELGATECSACKMQMEQGTGKPTLHPLKALALAYGLMPELAGVFKARAEELIIT